MDIISSKNKRKNLKQKIGMSDFVRVTKIDDAKSIPKRNKDTQIKKNMSGFDVVKKNKIINKKDYLNKSSFESVDNKQKNNNLEAEIKFKKEEDFFAIKKSNSHNSLHDSRKIEINQKNNYSKETKVLKDDSKELFLKYQNTTSRDESIEKKQKKLSNDSRRLTDINKISLKEKFSKKEEKIIKAKFLRKMSSNFGVVAFCLLLTIGSVFFVGDVVAIKDKVMASKDKIVASARTMLVSAKKSDIDSLQVEMQNSHKILLEIQNDLRSVGKYTIWLSKYTPITSKLSSGDALLAAAVDLVNASEVTVEYGKRLKEIKLKEGETFDFLEFATEGLKVLDKVTKSFESANNHLEVVRLDDLPQEGQKYVSDLRRILPEIESYMKKVVKLDDDIRDMLGANSPKTYLFLFQNNQETRATGGFIGSYGILDISQGKIREFYIDGIFNPDGQLADKIVPPLPIQKISAAWSLHDSNWWPDFPKSARTAMDFYERTGGNSVDGVITVTPTMMEKLLTITGPIYMKKYGITLTSDNFIEKTQYKVEVDYDKKENKPKKILSDLFPLVAEKLKQNFSGETAIKMMNIIIEGLDERHIMMYFKNENLQNYITSNKWGGEIQKTDSDYLSVINTNINGFKTDGVVDQVISHVSNIEEDGTIVDTVTIVREHRGGHTGKEWWDTVNDDYMRVYVPRGSKLISVTGHTREVNKERLSYDKIGFERYDEVKKEEDSIKIDKESGTRVYDESGKTVFANWVYVSPQEKVSVTYVYELPWKIDFKKDGNSSISSHGLLVQKQAGSTNVKLNTVINFPKSINIEWSTHKSNAHKLSVDTNLNKDFYQGVVLRKK